jgi:transposase InsO family protein
MFAALRTFSFFKDIHQITFKEILSDNGSEFRGNLEQHPFERLLKEMDIKHRFTRPMRPQTNGKIERFWKTLEEELVHETTFDSLEEFVNELHQYLYYYNHERLHSSLDQTPPVTFLQKSVNEICN